jgi:hypothetical protein
VINKGIEKFDDLTGSGKKNGKISRIKKATKWRDFSVKTASDGIKLADQALTVKDKHDPKSQMLNRGLEMSGSGISKKKLATALNKLEAYMSNVSKLKPTKLQLEVLQQAGVIDSVDQVKKAVKKTTGGSAPKKPAGAWVTHVKAYWKENGGTYKDAMKNAKASCKK